MGCDLLIITALTNHLVQTPVTKTYTLWTGSISDNTEAEECKGVKSLKGEC